MKILIIYEEIPETTKFYSVGVSAKEWKWMQLTHGHFINTDNEEDVEEALGKLSEWLDDKTPFEAPDPILLRGQNYDYVLHTGFVL